MSASPRWVLALALVPLTVAVLIGLLAPDPHGHWSEHLSSVGLKSAQLVVLVALITMLGWRRLSVVPLVAFAVVVFGIVLQVIGDYQVADSIWRTSDDPGFGAGYSEGHETSGFGDLLVIVGGLGFAIAAGITRRVPAKVAVLGGVMVIVPPPFFWPAAGVLMLVLYGITKKAGFSRAPVTP